VDSRPATAIQTNNANPSNNGNHYAYGHDKKGNGGGTPSSDFMYFYHTDHLGSTGYVTDPTGEVYQHMEYFAFGETFIEEHSNTNRIPYLFNGKELDEETGLYYYGARYYDPRTSIWQSVDPKAEKYPGWSPYNAMLNNPVSCVDPHGDSIIGKSNQRTAERIERGLNSQIDANNASVASSRTTITGNDAQIKTLQESLKSGTLSEKDTKRANRQIRHLESSNADENEKIAEKQNQTDELRQSLTNIGNLRSDVNYNYSFGGAPGFGSGEHGVLKGDGKEVIIQGSNDGLYVHEIRHIGQSLANGGLRFSTNPATLNRLLNAGGDAASRTGMEVDAYRAQFSIDRSSYPAPGGARRLSDINAATLHTIIGDSGNPLY